MYASCASYESILLQSGILPKDAKWRLKAGENLNFLFKLSDSRGNPAYMPQVTPTPDFTFSSGSGNEPVKVSFQCVDAEKGVLRLQTKDVCKPGTYHLKVDHHRTAYSLQVSPAKVDPTMCQLTGSGLRTTNPDNAQSVFKIQLKDKFGNVVSTSEILHSVLVTTTQPEVSVTKKMVDGVIVCSYCTPAEFRGSFQLEVIRFINWNLGLTFNISNLTLLKASAIHYFGLTKLSYNY